MFTEPFCVKMFSDETCASGCGFSSNSIYAGSLWNVSNMLKISDCNMQDSTLSVDPTLTLWGCPKDYFILNKGVTRQSTEAIYCTNVRNNYDSFTHLNTYKDTVLWQQFSLSDHYSADANANKHCAKCVERTTGGQPVHLAWLWLTLHDWQTVRHPHPPVEEDRHNIVTHV